MLADCAYSVSSIVIAFERSGVQSIEVEGEHKDNYRVSNESNNVLQV